MFCNRCALRWDVKDAAPPPCPVEARSHIPTRPLVTPARIPVEVQAKRNGKTLRQAAAGVDYRELLVKYMRHVAAEEGSTTVAQIGRSGEGYFSGVTFSASELAALIVCDGESKGD